MSDRPVAVINFMDKDYEIFVPGRGAMPCTLAVVTLHGRTVGIVRHKQGFTNVADINDAVFDYLNKL